MNKTEMIDAVAADTGLTKVDVSKVINSLVANTIEAVAKGDDFAIIGFGTFKAAQRQARPGRNPATGKPITIPAATLPKFTPGKAFKEAVNKPKKPARKAAARKGKK